MLCKKCSNIHFMHLWECGLPAALVAEYYKNGANYDEVYYFHHENRFALKTSADQGCHFCVMIWTALFTWSILDEHSLGPLLGDRVYLQGRYPDGVIENLGPERCPESTPSIAHIFVGCEGRISPYSSRMLDLPEPFASMLADLTLAPDTTSSSQLCDLTGRAHLCHSIFSPELDSTTTSKANVCLARTWLDRCFEGHLPCGARGLQPVLPHRIIDISKPEWPRLRDGKSGIGQYVALSYKWGTCKKYLTKFHNYLQHRMVIPLHKLPRTFREAIQVAYDLGFRFLWIDAICIIQDSQNDLEREIMLMDQIYQNATLTIFAAGGNDVNSGLSVARDPRTTKPAKIDIKLTVYGRTLKSSLYIVFDDVESGHYPLFDRGWVLQEEVLSQRCLIFGDDLLSWGCLCFSASERFPNTPKSTNSLKDMVEASGHIFNYPHRLDGFCVLRLWLADRDPLPNRFPSQRNNHFDEWYRMVSKYSTRTLTNPADVLPALQGLANAMARMHGDTYVSGLWMEDLNVGLAWSVVKNMEHVSPLEHVGSSERESSRIPSWSWASRWGYWIEFEKWESNHLLNEWESIKVEMTKIRSGRDEEKGLNVIGRVKVAEVYPWPKGYKPSDKYLWSGTVRDPDSGDKVGRIAYDADPETTELKSVACLLCTVRWKDNLQLICLALVSTNEALNEYRRVGLIFLHDEKWFGRFRHPYDTSRDRSSREHKDFCKYSRELRIV